MPRLLSILTLLTLSAYTPLLAQFSKGMRMPGMTIGNVFFNSGTTEYASTSPNTSGYTSNINKGGFTFSPGIGWFVTDELVVGAQLIAGYTYDKNIDDQNNVTFRKNIYRSFNGGIGAFARKYFSTTKSLIPFAQASLAGGTGSSKSEGFVYATSYKETYAGKSSGDFFANAGVQLGVTKMLNEHAGIDISAGYLFSHTKNTFSNNTARDIDFNGSIDETGVEEITTKKNNHGFMLSVGLQLFLKR
ncbi:hypothetical protein LZZ85_10030 [Terrimonas sp. NA20]|uniref:Outer membrane protein beta-barrel domain-containing protein n=1 Tax=Terrimonas ginsenosidimutans TaxID=2908004 RepID=A0ABS9KQL7_9BACT|nr:hypothetical protein [Terrimonas ginsenosidimutans]MCG2614622.1 hypothetical protein [Terrimonas ginsenosidimutans]